MVKCKYCENKLPKGRRVCDDCKKERRQISSIAWYKRNRWKIIGRRRAKKKEKERMENGEG